MATTEDLIAHLKERYEHAEKGKAVTAIHLFGIEFSEELQGHSLPEIAESATGHRSYSTELLKGRKLAEFVDVKPGKKAR